MPIDYSHQHLSSSILKVDDVHTPIDPNGAAAAISVTDGVTTVNPATVVSLPSGTVSNTGAGEATVAAGGGSISVTDGTTTVDPASSFHFPIGTLSAIDGEVVVDLVLRPADYGDTVFTIFDPDDNTVLSMRGDGAVVLDAASGSVLPLSVNVPANASNGVAIFKIAATTVVAIGGNDNIGYASMDILQADQTVPALHVGKFLGAQTGVLSVFTGGSPGDSAGKVGFYGATAVTRPIVPLTTPSVQNVIDALVALGLIAQSD